MREKTLPIIIIWLNDKQQTNKSELFRYKLLSSQRAIWKARADFLFWCWTERASWKPPPLQQLHVNEYPWYSNIIHLPRIGNRLEKLPLHAKQSHHENFHMLSLLLLWAPRIWGSGSVFFFVFPIKLQAWPIFEVWLHYLNIDVLQDTWNSLSENTYPRYWRHPETNRKAFLNLLIKKVISWGNCSPQPSI